MYYSSLLKQIPNKRSINPSTLCLHKTTKCPHNAQYIATSIAAPQQALHLLLGKTTQFAHNTV